MNLVESIKKEQERRGLNDAQLSELLELDPSTWSLVKSGKREPTGGKFLIAIMQKMPECSMAVIDYMRDGSAEEKVS